MKVYISLPITGYDLDERRDFARWTAERLRAAGYTPVNPFDNELPTDREYTPREAYAYYMGKDIESLLNCDAMLITKSNSDSKGCLAELLICTTYHIPFVTRIGDLEPLNTFTSSPTE